MSEDSRRKKISRIEIMLGIIIFMILYVICFVFPQAERLHNYDLALTYFITITVMAISMLIFVVKTRLAYFALIFTLSFCILNFGLFPLGYYLMMDKNPDSFIVEEQIKHVEKADAQQSLQHYYQPNELGKVGEVINNLINKGPDKILDSINYLPATINSREIAVIDSLIFSEETEYLKGGFMHRPQIFFTAIYSKNGEYIGRIKDQVGAGQSLRSFFKEQETKINQRLNEYEHNDEAIKKKDRIWKFSTLWPYTIDIFNTDSIRPKSPGAHIYHWFHNTICYLLLASIVISFIIELFNKSRYRGEPSKEE